MDASREEIERKAYEIWDAEGRPQGLHEIHWSRAEEMLVGLTEPAGSPERPQPGQPATAPNQDTSLGPDEDLPIGRVPDTGD
ncbi:hypothetical protein C3941_17975 [Kaistia algarum]|uniref:DUF2934 domain-containing protein n=1 Tax=Kaistia algarum TaxID=2083279 RepID=UPI000CE7665F|nr:DUF2934 domain-containing protein [Kaistia algarum]MCX5516760.1 DUF2934 domain-containing protein [Kaistia algarum]PPE78651.1 hypothetical protein C3941_17975 [Kaistia algarum]